MRARRGAAYLLAATRERKFPRKEEGKKVQRMPARTLDPSQGHESEPGSVA